MSKHKSKHESAAAVAPVVENDEVALAAAIAEVETDEVALTDAAAVEAAVAEVETIEAKHEAYAEQPPADEASAASTPTEEGSAASKPKKARTPRVSMTSGLKASEVIKATIDDATLASLLGAESAEVVDNTLAKIDTLDKKSREKATNLFSAVKAGRKPSVYVMQTLEALASEPLTLKGLTDYFLGRKYKIGTARRQASEMFALLPVVGIAFKDATRGSAMSLNVESPLFKAIKS